MALKLRKNRIKIANKIIRIQPMNAKDGLEAVIQFSSIIHEATPYLSILTDRSRRVRMMALGKLAREIDEIPDVLFEIVSISTGLSRYELETEATLKEVFTAFGITVKINDWDKFWSAAYALRIADGRSVVEWTLASLRRLTVRG